MNEWPVAAAGFVPQAACSLLGTWQSCLEQILGVCAPLPATSSVSDSLASRSPDLPAQHLVTLIYCSVYH